eukprot:3047842-Prymnesium_polylepis.1
MVHSSPGRRPAVMWCESVAIASAGSHEKRSRKNAGERCLSSNLTRHESPARKTVVTKKSPSRKSKNGCHEKRMSRKKPGTAGHVCSSAAGGGLGRPAVSGCSG